MDRTQLVSPPDRGNDVDSQAALAKAGQGFFALLWLGFGGCRFWLAVACAHRCMVTVSVALTVMSMKSCSVERKNHSDFGHVASRCLVAQSIFRGFGFCWLR